MPTRDIRHGSLGACASVSALMLLGIPLLGAAARAQPSRLDTPTMREIISAHLNLGMGESPFETPIVADSTAAALLIAARTGESIRALKMIEPDDAALRQKLDQLVEANLLLFRGDSVFTAVPILLYDERDAYRRLTDEAAARVLARIRPDLEGVLAGVERRGWSDWQYHFIWSQVFDSQFTWSELMEREMVRPLSEVVAWIVYPEHRLMSGTNYYPDDEIRDYFLPVSWTLDGANTVAAVGGAWKSIYASAIDGNRSGEVRAQLRHLGLLTDGGGPLVPVVASSDPLYTDLKEAARAYVSALAETVPTHELASLIGRDERLAMGMAVHDVSWEILALLIAEGRVSLPPALRSNADPESSMIGVAALIATYQPFVDELLRALGVDQP